MLSLELSNDAELQLLQMRHAEEVFSIIESNRDHLRPWLHWVDDARSVEDTKAFVQRCLEEFAAGTGITCSVWRSGEVVGIVGLTSIELLNRSGVIGYWLAEDHQGKGLMTMACHALLDHAFGNLELNRVEILVATDNVKSRAIPERLGFRREGTLRQAEWMNDRYVDLDVYAMLREEWRTQGERGA
jgi:ribosomal-protein-serine acetyltransferase